MHTNSLLLTLNARRIVRNATSTHFQSHNIALSNVIFGHDNGGSDSSTSDLHIVGHLAAKTPYPNLEATPQFGLGGHDTQENATGWSGNQAHRISAKDNTTVAHTEEA